MNELTVVMYHYVRALARSRYPAIKGLDVGRFRGQLAYLEQHGRFVGVEDVLAACRGEDDLPPDAVLLTFDDGYADHWRYVFPLLDERGVQGCFFAPVRAVRDRVVLDVHKIHFTLAACGDPGLLAAHCLARIADWRDEYGLEAPAQYEAGLPRASRFDDPRTLFVKRLLQRGLPEAARARLADELFRRFVTADEAAFAEELYLDVDQVRAMRRGGMWFGAHGQSHRWLDGLDESAQHAELLASSDWLRELGYEDGEFVVAYPYGGYDATTVAVARELGYGLGFTVEVRVARIGRDDPLLLPRLDTVDVPCDPAAAGRGRPT
ncbi:MAG TPA: polysaccharide deacetylase family protein [Candidatus Krumholzibacteria bacterium]|nr:polysaccharide deacetylase family protein [Candidatus Krumholzibacteria bacterium]HPD70995.1 polysaccharide deacetylase family protein [Candidatus Krumholzibacteria bacterium]HRY39305.1 polysaccharide deacetylase family protein [Candidatus Krumholzibacteria bacterium]